MVFSIGIDLGTSNCCISICDHAYNRAVVKFGEDELLESAVNFANPERVVVGSIKAYRPQDFLDGNVVLCNKRILGRLFNDPDIQEVIKNCEAKVVTDSDGFCAYYIPKMDRIVSTEEVLVELIRKLYDAALGQSEGAIPESVCITVPVTFNQKQRYITRKAAEKVIKNCPIRLISEPSAAAIEYSLSTSIQNGHILIYDLGGGTFDVSIIRITNGNHYEILGTSGHPTIGGNCFDERLKEHIRLKFEGDDCQDCLEPTGDESKQVYRSAMLKLRNMCRINKEDLSCHADTVFCVDEFFSYLKECRKAERNASSNAYYDDSDNYDDSDGIENDPITIIRTDFERLITQDIKTTIDLTKECIERCGLSKHDIDRILLVGGSSYIPLVKKLLRKEFGERKIGADINPSTCVARGASLIGQYGFNSITEKNHLFITDRTIYGIGIEYKRKGKLKIMIPPNTKLPVETRHDFNINKHNKAEFVKCKVYEVSNTGENRLIRTIRVKTDPFFESDGKIGVVFKLSKEGELTIEYKDKDDKIIQRETSILELV